MKALLITLLAAGLATSVLAADTPSGPPTFMTQGKVNATMKTNPVYGNLRLGKQSIIFERTDLQKLASKANTEIGHRGKGEKELDWICLTDETAQVRLWLTAGGLSNGYVDGVTLAYLPHAQANDNCPQMPEDWRKITLPNGLALQMPGADLKAKVGTPSYDKDGLVGYYYSTDMAGGGLRTAQLWAAVDHGKVGILAFTQVTT